MKNNIDDKQDGFTVLELLIVVAIIGLLSGILFASINPKEQSEKAKVAKTVQELKSIKDAVVFYVLDTGQLPPNCRLDCDSSSDPMINSLNIAGWHGPYIKKGLYNRSHPWGGQIGLVSIDSNGNGLDEVWVVLDDDEPMTNAGNNKGRVPEEDLKRIDEYVDNGDLADGAFFMGNGASIFPEGEGAWRVYRIGEH